MRRETAGEYLRAAGIALRCPGGWGRHGLAKPAINLITDSEGGDSTPASEVSSDISASKPGCGPTIQGARSALKSLYTRTPKIWFDQEGHQAQDRAEFMKHAANSPIARVGRPEDVANAVLFLANDMSQWMTRAHLVMDGGELE